LYSVPKLSNFGSNCNTPPLGISVPIRYSKYCFTDLDVAISSSCNILELDKHHSKHMFSRDDHLFIVVYDTNSNASMSHLFVPERMLFQLCLNSLLLILSADYEFHAAYGVLNV